MYVKSTDSTNTLLKELIAKGQEPKYIYAGYQTAGRGQKGNGWESEADKNLLCSILIDISHLSLAVSPFYLNVAVSVAVHRLLSQQLIAKSQQLAIKWPNDIYWKDKKIAGILIENTIFGSELKYSIAGIGLNVNQTEFKSDAPNPVSLKQITGKEYDLDELMRSLYDEVQKTLDENVWEAYKAHLYRREGTWPFVEREVSLRPSRMLLEKPENAFVASIEDITPQGELVLRTDNGVKKYHFKEIQFVL